MGPRRESNGAVVLLVLALVCAALLPGTDALPLLDRDEPRFATATREMLEGQEWVVPTFNGAPRYDKPILVYWVMRSGYWLFGVGELGARLPSLLAAAALLLMVAFGARRWVGRGPAAAAAVVLGTTLQFVIHGRLALADMLMVTCVAAAQLALAALLLVPEPPRTRRAWLVLWSALGFGFLAKGPIALAVPALSLVLLRYVTLRVPLPWSRLRALPGFALTGAIVAAWGVPALLATHGDFLRVGIGRHVIERGLDGFDARPYSPLFYLEAAPLSLFPWIVLAPVVVRELRRRRDGWNAWLLAWFLAPYIIFTPYRTQLPHYVLPGFPAVALLVARGLEHERAPRPPRRAALVLGALACALCALVAWVWTRPAPAELGGGGAAIIRGAAAAVALLATSAACAAAWLSQRRVLAAGALVLFAGATEGLGRSLRACHATLAVARALVDVPNGARLVTVNFAEPSLVFYSHLRLEPTDSAGLAALTADADPTSAVGGPAALVTLAREARIEGALLGSGALTWRVPEGVEALHAHLFNAGWRASRVAGFNPGRSRWQELDVWLRR
ncbi:MAG: glycosyltransferase family 39 protein [Planctomycetota bacterium]